MADFGWVGAQEALTNESLTVVAQTVDPTDDGQLLWDAFFPRQDVDSVKIAEMTDVDFRPAADRREWNQRGRNVPLRTPASKELEMVPIESYFTYDERAMQHLMERTLGNESLFQQIVGMQIPTRTEGLAGANWRRVELDVMEAWSQGQITAMNPQTGSTQVMSFGFDAARYTTAGTAWDDVGTNAYDDLIAWLESSIPFVGAFSGIVCRLATYQAIQVDAPNKFIPDSALGLRVSRAQLEQLISDDLGQPFRFFIVENMIDVFDDGGIAYTRTNIWPAGVVAIVPAGTVVGNLKMAPVARAVEMSRQVPSAGIDVRGVTVYHEQANGGRQLTVEAQLNALPVPNEQNTFVIDTLVT
jgi:hypothetical protein